MKEEVEMETIEDVVAEMRRDCPLYHADGTRYRDGDWAYTKGTVEKLADRIEAAHKREREAGAEAAQICGGIGEMVGREAACHQPVIDCHGLNAATMREALEALVGVIDECNSGNPLWWHIGAKGVKPLKDARAALAASPRNCDVGTVEGQVMRFREFCLQRKCSECQFKDNREYGECLVHLAQIPYEEGGAQ